MKRKIVRSKCYRVIRKLLKTTTPEVVTNNLLDQIELEKLLMIMCNECVFKSNSILNKKKKKAWYGVARLIHRAMDELKLEKEKKTIFKVSRRDIYTCKCKKRFYVDPLHDKNCAFDVDRGLVIVTCPHCGKKE